MGWAKYTEDNYEMICERERKLGSMDDYNKSVFACKREQAWINACNKGNGYSGLSRRKDSIVTYRR